jgi:RNA polymerase sigma-70 factor, ECF subfamily
MLTPTTAETSSELQPGDDQLLAAIGAGDHGEPMRVLYWRYAGRLYCFGIRALGNRGLAEELVQETFVRLWQSAARYDPGLGTPSVAKRLAVDVWRRPSSRPVNEEIPDKRPRPIPTGGDQIERLLLQLGVQDALESLPAAQRDVLELSYRHHMKQSEIALHLGIPLGTVKTRSYDGLRSLRGALRERGFYASDRQVVS